MSNGLNLIAAVKHKEVMRKMPHADRHSVKIFERGLRTTQRQPREQSHFSHYLFETWNNIPIGREGGYKALQKSLYKETRESLKDNNGSNINKVCNERDLSIGADQILDTLRSSLNKIARNPNGTIDY